MLRLPKNRFEQLAEKPSKPFHPRQIVHARLKVRSECKGALEFWMDRREGEEQPEDIPESVLQAYARRVANGEIRIFGADEEPPETPFDLKVGRQCWIVLELDPDLKNWQFGRGFVGCTTKGKHKGDNFRLRHVYPDEDGASVEPVKGRIRKDGCRVVYFGLARRGRRQSQYFNLHTEFLQAAEDDAKKLHRMVVIFDPDVGNNGGFPIPPDPPPPPPPPTSKVR